MPNLVKPAARTRRRVSVVYTFPRTGGNLQRIIVSQPFFSEIIPLAHSLSSSTFNPRLLLSIATSPLPRCHCGRATQASRFSLFPPLRVNLTVIQPWRRLQSRSSSVPETPAGTTSNHSSALSSTATDNNSCSASHHQLLLSSSEFHVPPPVTSFSPPSLQQLPPLFPELPPYPLYHHLEAPYPSEGHLLADVTAGGDFSPSFSFLSPYDFLQELEEHSSLPIQQDNARKTTPRGSRETENPAMTTSELSAPSPSLSNSNRPHSLALRHDNVPPPISCSSLPSASLTASSPSPSTQSSSIASRKPANSDSNSFKRSLAETQSPVEDEAVIEKRQRNTIAARKARRKKDDRIASLETELAAVMRERDEMKLLVARLEGENAALKKVGWG